jgi:hypothetical protein
MPPPAPTEKDEAAVIATALPARTHPEETAPHEVDNYSRELRVVVGQFFEIPYRGKGWIFLGEMNSSRGISFDSRRVDDEGQTFVFRALNEGEYFVKFNKQDFVNNYYVNDTVKVIVGENTGNIPTGYLNSTRVTAPRWEAPAPNMAGAAANTTAANVTAPNTAAVNAEAANTATPNLAAAEGSAALPVALPAAQPVAQPVAVANGGVGLMPKARTDFDAKKYADVISALDTLAYEAALDDEAYWLYGQSFEANSPSRNIKAALAAYQSLIRNFPMSKYYEDAEGRVAYLNKFYIDIR